MEGNDGASCSWDLLQGANPPATVPILGSYQHEPASGGPPQQTKLKGKVDYIASNWTYSGDDL